MAVTLRHVKIVGDHQNYQRASFNFNAAHLPSHSADVLILSMYKLTNVGRNWLELYAKFVVNKYFESCALKVRGGGR